MKEQEVVEWSKIKNSVHLTLIIKRSQMSKIVEKIGFAIVKVGFWIARYKNVSIATVPDDSADDDVQLDVQLTASDPTDQT